MMNPNNTFADGTVPNEEATEPEGSTRSEAREQRAERNRQNAKRSTGPKSLAGKNRSRWNSLKHGVLAKSLLQSVSLTDEHKQSFTLLHEALHEQITPEGPLEHMQVERIVIAYWRLSRCARFEAETFTKPEMFWSTGIDRLNRYTAAAQRELSQAAHELERLQRQRRGESLPMPVQVDLNLIDTTSQELPPGFAPIAQSKRHAAALPAGVESDSDGTVPVPGPVAIPSMMGRVIFESVIEQTPEKNYETKPTPISSRILPHAGADFWELSSPEVPDVRE
jgi:hypothetical protein